RGREHGRDGMAGLRRPVVDARAPARPGRRLQDISPEVVDGLLWMVLAVFPGAGRYAPMPKNGPWRVRPSRVVRGRLRYADVSKGRPEPQSRRQFDGRRAGAYGTSRRSLAFGCREGILVRMWRRRLSGIQSGGSHGLAKLELPVGPVGSNHADCAVRGAGRTRNKQVARR